MVNDRIQTYPESRATLRYLQYGNFQIKQNTTVTILPPKTAGSRGTIDLIRGAIYLFFRGQPREVLIQMPHGVGASLGTDLAVTVDENGRSTVAVFDGEVELSNGWGPPVKVSERHVGIMEQGQKPRIEPIQAVNIVQWWLYYPGIIDTDELALTTEEKKTLEQSIAAYRTGDLTAALQRYPAERVPGSAAERLYYAGLLLAAGQVEQAEAELAELGNAPFTNALREMIAAVQHRPFQGNPTPASATEWMARSYYQQSTSGLAEARQSVREAVSKSPEFGFAWARLAELEFSFAERRKLTAALGKALALSPRNGQAIALRGFVLAAENRFRDALQAFQHAIDNDPNLANAWLGRGLVRIRQGDTEGGRQDIQTAAGLEPNRSLLRSYLGKAYAFVNADRFADKELAFARELDPNDPTPWLYSALFRREQNEINLAVLDLEESIELNNNRSIYRSRFLLDQDRAVRSSSLATIYQSAGMQEVALREAVRGVSYDYANYSAHLFVSDAFNALRDPTRFNLRYETVWFNELLLANLLAPSGATPLSQSISQQEYARLFERNRLGLSSDTQYRSDGQFREVASQFGFYKNTAYSLDLDYQRNEGVRRNNELDRIEWYATIKHQLTRQDSVLLLTKYQDYHSGDNFQYYDPEKSVRRDFSFDEYQEPILLGGYHHEWKPGIHTLVLAGRLVNEQRFRDRNAAQRILTKADDVFDLEGSNSFDVEYQSELEIYTGEIGQIFDSQYQTLVLGARYQNGRFDTRSLLSNPTGPPGINFPGGRVNTVSDEEFERHTAYGYYTLKLPARIRLTGGLAYDTVEFPQTFRTTPVQPGRDSREQFGPKGAIVWDIAPATTFRGAYSRSLGGASLDESYRLEPTQLAGFSQAFRTVISETPETGVGSVSAPVFESWGAAVDFKSSTRTYAGLALELIESQIDDTVGVIENDPVVGSVRPSATPNEINYRERSFTVTMNQLLADEWAFGARYRFSHAELQSIFPETNRDHPNEQRTIGGQLSQVELFGLYQHACGLFSRANARWWWQRNERDLEGLRDDSFYQVDILIGYRLRRQKGELTIGVLNVNDTDYRVHPVNAYSELPRERVFAGRVLFNF